jgi:hypothetical protein
MVSDTAALRGFCIGAEQIRGYFHFENAVNIYTYRIRVIVNSEDNDRNSINKSS